MILYLMISQQIQGMPRIHYNHKVGQGVQSWKRNTLEIFNVIWQTQNVLKNQVLWNFMTCWSVNSYCEDKCIIVIPQNITAYQLIWHCIPEEMNLEEHSYENSKSHTEYSVFKIYLAWKIIVSGNLQGHVQSQLTCWKCTLCRRLLGACAAAWSCCYMLLLNHNPLHIVIIYEHMALWLWVAFFPGQEVWKSHGNKSGLYTGTLSNSCCMEFSWSWSLWATQEWELLGSSMMPSVSL